MDDFARFLSYSATLPRLRRNVAAIILRFSQLRRRHASCAGFRLSIACSAAFAVSRLSCARSGAAGAERRLAHQAVYDLSLKTSRGNAGVNNATGRILYNFTGSACEGYTTEFRQVSQLDAGRKQGHGERPALDQLGRQRRQDLSLQDRHPNERCGCTSVDGIAERDGKTIKVKLKKPKARPSPSTARCFRPSRSGSSSRPPVQGKSLLELVVYDGSDDGEKVYNTLTVIGQPIPGQRLR
jgi:hypothetical protein